MSESRDNKDQNRHRQGTQADGAGDKKTRIDPRRARCEQTRLQSDKIKEAEDQATEEDNRFGLDHQPDESDALATRVVDRTAEATERLETDLAPASSGVEPTVAMTAAGSLPEDEGRTRLTVGSVLRKRFRITGVLGEGGMGAVYSAVDLLKEEARDENVNVALKVMKPDIVDAELSFMGLQREARRAQQLAHPNIVTVYDFDRADGVIYMTMEYLRGQPLDAMLKRKRHGLALDQARDLTAQICRGLSHAHEEGIVHADLKPQNIFVLDSGRAKILDFGIARAWQAKKVDRIESIFSGYSPAFASPEVIARSAPTPADDVFALGCVVYLLFTGQHPFDWKPADQAHKLGLKPSRHPSFKRAEWSAVQAALSLDRERRPADARAFYKRFAPSRVRQWAVAVSLASILAAVAVVVLYEPPVGPEVPFEQLSVSLQDEIRRNLGDAEQFLAFGDFDSALQLYDMVLRAHPGNLDAVAGMRSAADQAIERVRQSVSNGDLDPALARQSLDGLLAYETLPAASRRKIERARDQW